MTIYLLLGALINNCRSNRGGNKHSLNDGYRNGYEDGYEDSYDDAFMDHEDYSCYGDHNNCDDRDDDDNLYFGCDEFDLLKAKNSRFIDPVEKIHILFEKNRE